MIVLDLDGNIIEGGLLPSSETASHLYIYRHLEHVSGVLLSLEVRGYQHVRIIQH